MRSPIGLRAPLIALFAAAFVLAPARAAFAQAPLPAPPDQAKATTGSTEITSDKAAALDRAAAAEAKDANELSLSAGGLQSTGNASLLALTTAEKFRLRRGENQFKQAFAGNYARSAPPPSEADPSPELATTIANLQGLLRYDRFLGDFTLFFGSQVRSDKFQGINARINVDPGVGYYFINEKAHAFWAELGYDFQYDNRRADAIVKPDGTRLTDRDGVVLERTKIVHSARTFLGYENAFNDSSKLSAGIEYLQGVSDTKFYRVNSDVALTTKLVKSLAISFAFSERFDSQALPGKRKTDTLTSASLVYTFL